MVLPYCARCGAIIIVSETKLVAVRGRALGIFGGTYFPGLLDLGNQNEISGTRGTDHDDDEDGVSLQQQQQQQQHHSSPRHSLAGTASGAVCGTAANGVSLDGLFSTPTSSRSLYNAADVNRNPHVLCSVGTEQDANFLRESINVSGLHAHGS